MRTRYKMKFKTNKFRTCESLFTSMNRKINEETNLKPLKKRPLEKKPKKKRRGSRPRLKSTKNKIKRRPPAQTQLPSQLLSQHQLKLTSLDKRRGRRPDLGERVFYLSILLISYQVKTFNFT